MRVINKFGKRTFGEKVVLVIVILSSATISYFAFYGIVSFILDSIVSG